MLSERIGGGEEGSLKSEDVLEVVDEGFAVEVVIGSGEEVPIQASHQSPTE